MSESNNRNTLLRQYIEQEENALEMDLLELQRLNEESTSFLQHTLERLRTEGVLVQSHFVNEFESQFGYPIDLFPFFFSGTFGYRTVTTTREDRPTNVERIRFFELKFARLADDNNRVSSFRSTFRVDQGTFEWLVNRLQDHEELQFDSPNAIPVYIQVAICLIRLANAHISYRMAYLDWYVSYGSFTNFTRRVVKAIKGLLSSTTIQWPTTYDRASEIAIAFQYPLSNPGRRFDNIVGAIDGKNCIIRMPSPPEYGAFFRDRNNHYSVKLTAVCDYDCRFTYIRVGDSG
jgi:hypothetical protein